MAIGSDDKEIAGIKCASDALEPRVQPSDQKFAKSYDFSSAVFDGWRDMARLEFEPW